jgi:hypothetical protein
MRYVKIIAAVTMLVIVPILIWLVFGWVDQSQKVIETQKMVNREAAWFLGQMEDGKILSRRKAIDPWGKSILYRGEVSERQRTARTVSAGPDREFFSSDDIKGEAVDLNKSRMVGEWVGKKATEFGKGFLEGLSKESKFKD